MKKKFVPALLFLALGGVFATNLIVAFKHKLLLSGPVVYGCNLYFITTALWGVTLFWLGKKVFT